IGGKPLPLPFAGGAAFFGGEPPLPPLAGAAFWGGALVGNWALGHAAFSPRFLKLPRGSASRGGHTEAGRPGASEVAPRGGGGRRGSPPPGWAAAAAAGAAACRASSAAPAPAR